MTIDERLQFLVQSTESLHASCQQLHAAVEQLRATVSGQAEIQAQHEKRWEIMRQVMLAALRTFFQEGE
jgi:hypothetical protein